MNKFKLYYNEHSDVLHVATKAQYRKRLANEFWISVNNCCTGGMEITCPNDNEDLNLFIEDSDEYNAIVYIHGILADLGLNTPYATMQELADFLEVAFATIPNSSYTFTVEEVAGGWRLHTTGFDCHSVFTIQLISV